MGDKDNEDSLDIPAFLRVSKEQQVERNASWVARPPTQAMSAFKEVPAKNLTAEALQILEEQSQRKKVRDGRRIAKMKAGFDKNRPTAKTHDWDGRRGTWIAVRLYYPERKMKPEFDKMSGPELVKVHNEMAVEAAGLGIKGVSAVKTFRMLAAGIRRCNELWVKLTAAKGINQEEGTEQNAPASPSNEATASQPKDAEASAEGEDTMATRKTSATRKTAKKARGGAAKKTAKKTRAASANGTSRLIAGFPPASKLKVLVKENPRTGKVAKRFDSYKQCKTIGDYVELWKGKIGGGQAAKDLAWDLERKFIEIVKVA